MSIHKRITWFNTITVSILIAFIFMAIYGVVYYSSYKHLDDDIMKEKDEVINNIDWDDEGMVIRKMPEWDEAEHKQLEANPTFIQIVNSKGELLFKSTNLMEERFQFKTEQHQDLFYNYIANGQRLRLGQFPIYNDKKENLGILTIAISQQESFIVLQNLSVILIISYLLILVTSFALLWYVTKRAIHPITQLIQATTLIDERNLNARLPLPHNKDEIHHLATTINELLHRIESIVVQQKQFTADISHEMRTPLTAIKGTLEVLLRKERSVPHYQEKINSVLEQTNRLNQLYDEMLMLAKIDADSLIVNKDEILIQPLLEHIIADNREALEGKSLSVVMNIEPDTIITADRVLIKIVLNNIFTNAIKYNKLKGHITISWQEASRQLSIEDSGIGMDSNQLTKIFDRFFRTDYSRSSEIQGYGLGLSIVKRLCDLQQININVTSKEGVGSNFSLNFP